MKLMIIIASTRPGRVGLPVGNWFYEIARKDKRFETELVDLAELNLPFLDEPNLPALQQYTKEHTKKWSRMVNSSDCFVIVTPEYNFSGPATLINALDFVYKEWNYKAVGFVSYGGLSGGTRSVQHLKNLVTTLKMTPLYEAVNIPFIASQIKNGNFIPNDKNEAAAVVMLDELYKVALETRELRK